MLPSGTAPAAFGASARRLFCGRHVTAIRLCIYKPKPVLIFYLQTLGEKVKSVSQLQGGIEKYAMVLL